MEIKKASKIGVNENVAYLIHTDKDLNTKDFSKEELSYLKKEIKAENKQVVLNKFTKTVVVVVLDKGNDYIAHEKARIAGSNLINELNKLKLTSVVGQSKTNHSTIGTK